MITFSQIFPLVFFIFFFGFTYYLGGIIGVFETILTLIVYCFVTFAVYDIWKSLKKKNSMHFSDYIIFFLYRVSIFCCIIGIITGSFCYYFNELKPTSMPTYTLTDGDKTIVFQAMSHIGSKDFYSSVKNNLETKKKEGYVYFFEGVQPGTEKNMQKFDAALGIQFDEDLYKNFSKLYGVDYQDNSIFLNLINNKDYNVDISIDEIIAYYESDKKGIKNEKTQATMQPNKEIYDINSEVIKSLALLNDKQLAFLQYVNQAMLNFIIGSAQTQSFIQNNFSNKRLFEIILDKRDEHLAEEIIKSKDKKIFITYGLLHFKGVYKHLVEDNPKWKIIKTDLLYPIQ